MAKAVSPSAELTLAESDPHRYEEIDAIRGIIIVLVMVGSFGLRYQNSIGHVGAVPFFGYPVVGYLATQLFFSVTAYRRILELGDARDAWGYASAAVRRYAPSVWPSVLMIWLMTQVSPGFEPVPVSALPANLTMTADLLGSPLVDAGHWRLKLELLLILGTGIIWFALGQRYLAASLTGLLIIAASTANWLEPVRHQGISLVGALTLDGYLPHCIFGMSLCQLVSPPRPDMTGAVSHFVWLLMATAAFILAVLGNTPEHRPFVYGALFLVIGAVCGGLPSLGRLPLLPWLGRISLPIYLIHLTPGFALIGWLERHGCPVALAMLAAAGLSIALGAAIERWAEPPAELVAAKISIALATAQAEIKAFVTERLMPTNPYALRSVYSAADLD